MQNHQSYDGPLCEYWLQAIGYVHGAKSLSNDLMHVVMNHHPTVYTPL